LLEAPLAGARLEVLDVAEDHGTSEVGRSLQRGRVIVDLADAAHTVLVEVALDGVSGFAPARERGQLVKEVLVLDVLQEFDHVRMGTDHVRDVQERQTHLRRDVVRDGLRERVGRVLLSQPVIHQLVEPPGGLHSRHEHLVAARIEQDPPQLLEVREDEVEQRRPGLRLDVALQGGEGGLAALDQIGDDGRIGLDRDGRAASQRLVPAGVRAAARACVWISVGEVGDEAGTFEYGPQRVAEQRVGSSRDSQQACASLWRTQRLSDVDEQSSRRPRPSAAGLVSCQTASPSGFMASVIICW